MRLERDDLRETALKLGSWAASKSGLKRRTRRRVQRREKRVRAGLAGGITSTARGQTAVRPCVRMRLLDLLADEAPRVVALLVEGSDAQLEGLVELERDDDLRDARLVGRDAVQPAGTHGAVW